MPDRFSISDVAPACWRLGRHFDLVFLTGHAFQVFLTDDDQRAVLSTIAEHLASGGRFIFDTRSPAAQVWREWTPMPSMRRFDHPSLGPVEAWNDIGHDATTGIVTYQTHYRVVSSEQHFSAASKLRFTNQERLAALLEVAGREVDEWLGDWQGNAYQPKSREIIPVGGLP